MPFKHRRHAVATLLLSLLSWHACSPCTASWLFSFKGSPSPAPTPVTQLTFEEAYQGVLSSSQHVGEAEHFDRLVAWLHKLAPQLSIHVQEMKNSHVQAILAAAVRLTPARVEEAALITALQDITQHLEQLEPTSGWPLTRRVVVGALFKQRAAGEPFPDTTTQLINRILVRLFSLHRKAAAQKGIIQFFHISKSGGTNMCMAAESNGCTTEGFNERLNCMVREFNDQPRWATYAAHKYVQHSMRQKTNTPWFVNFGSMRKTEMSCAQRATYLREKQWNFYANEFTVPSGELGVCSEFVNLMIFRDPIQRLSSQISWIQKLYKALHNASDIGQAFRGRTSSFWERLIPAAANNYYTRSLMGPPFFQTPIIAINATHVQVAMLKVLQHDLLMMLEQKEFNDVVLQVGLGWQNSIKDDKIRSSSDIKKEIVMPVDYDRLISHNRPDVEVHKFAEALQLFDVLLFKYVAAVDHQLQSSTVKPQCGFVSAP